ncbi:Imm1 family immunity protein [Labedaea rhizosphaerae]|uniref:Immunity protein Imm1 of predicted polymorphic toxin system n=1 Tax=Labedaea rhizosphaerae TaxID=598644 RepID=A0A4V3CYC5_LABRH|nr:Imm1 family immunity protein [Labedaea rhizosphaerae]TDP93648.1 immunity protein Imm1 of predicted polymorphic toxin system [Labedaea rhizosphaerae]
MRAVLRIRGDVVDGERSTATADDSRIALVDHYLGELSARPRGGVVFLELDRAGDGFVGLDRYRHVVDGAPTETPEVIEYVRVGVLGTLGAAEWVRLRVGSDELTVCATDRADSVDDQPRVLYDGGVPYYFPPTTVVPLAQVRRLMVDFATTGQWSDAVPWKPHDQMLV